MSNKALRHALNSLAHPVSVFAIILLLLNDHLLRIHWPSWWTGKLGDAAWLVFAPFVLAIVVALFIPRNHPQQEQIVGLVSIAAIGIWFTLAKTVPAVHALTVNILDNLVGWQGTLGMDVTDLITLPALAVSWFVWHRTPHTSLIPSRIWVVAALGVMTTVATSCMIPDYGVRLLCESESTIFALTGHEQATRAFFSRDGGQNWELTENEALMESCFFPRKHIFWRRNPWLFTENGRTYRFDPGTAIYSYDEELIEQLEFDLTQVGHDVRASYHEGRSGFLLCPAAVSYTGPLDAVIDDSSGNLILAMGHNGILLQTNKGQWLWADVGGYHYVELTQINLLPLLEPELFLGLMLLGLFLATLIYLIDSKKTFLIALSLGLGWLLWCVLTRFFMFSHIAILTIIIVLSLNTWVIHRVRTSEKITRPVSLAMLTGALVAALLFLLPYVLWVRGTMPNHTSASVFAFILSTAALMTTHQYILRRYMEKKKKAGEEDEGDSGRI